MRKKVRLNVTDCDWLIRKSDNDIRLTMDNPQFEVDELRGGYAILGRDYLVVDHAINSAVRVDVNLQPIREHLEPVLKAVNVPMREVTWQEASLCEKALDLFARSPNCGFTDFIVVKM